MLKDITVEKGYECLNACILNWLHYSGVIVNSSDIYFASEVDHLKFNDITEELSINAYEKNFSFMDKYCVTYKMCNSTKDNCIDQLNKIVANNNHIILKTCPEKLGYTNAFSLNRDAPHFINVLDIKEDGKILILDGYIPTLNSTTFIGYIDFEDFLEAWAEREYEYILLDNLEELNTEKIKNEAVENFKNTIKNYCIESEKFTDYNFGDEVLKLFYCFFNRVKIQDIPTENYVEDFFFKIKVFGFMIEKQMVFQKLQEGSSEIAKKYERLIGKWNGILLFTRKAIYTKKNTQLDQIYEKICEVVIEEKRLFEYALSQETSR